MTIEREEAQRHNWYLHTDLRPLVTTCTSKGRYMSSSPVNEYGTSASPASLSSAIGIASPSLAAVRKYYRDHFRRTVFQTELSLTEHRVYFLESILRGEKMRERRSLAEVSREILLDGVNRSELARLGGFVSRRPFTPRPSILSTISMRISADPTLDRPLA